MNISTLIRQHCCNYRHACLGVAMNGRAFRPEGECYLLQSDRKPCPHFEAVLIPIARQLGSAQSIELAYKMLRPNLGIKKARQCGCGAELPPRSRMCQRCRKHARQQSYRQARQRAGLSATVKQKRGFVNA